MIKVEQRWQPVVSLTSKLGLHPEPFGFENMEVNGEDDEDKGRYDQEGNE